MKAPFTHISLPVCACVVVTAAWFTSAGNLNPAPGPVAGTMKPLSDVEPRIAVNAANTPGDLDSVFKITQPGSYYLTGNITGVSGKSGIKITSSNVTIDLNGFSVQGIPGTLHGIVLNGLQSVVRNGTVTGWRNWGISGGGPFCRIEDVMVNANEGGGISAGSNAVITRCIATGSADTNGPGHGISTGIWSIIRDCTISGNQGSGLWAGHGAIVTNVVASSNNPTSESGILCGNASVISGCVVKDNYKGLEVGVGSTVQNTAVVSNERGILGDVGITIHSCTITDTENCGIEAFDSLIRGNTFDNPNGTDICGTGNLLIENKQ